MKGMVMGGESGYMMFHSKTLHGFPDPSGGSRCSMVLSSNVPGLLQMSYIGSRLALSAQLRTTPESLAAVRSEKRRFPTNR